jgi:prevent-host-death family protein
MPATIASVTTARRDFSEICNRVAYGHERVAIERHGKNCVAVVPYEDVELLEAIEDQLDLRAAVAALKEAEDEGTVSWDDLKRELSL